jgi:hypothetical protein
VRDEWGKEKRDGNTEVTEVRTQRAQGKTKRREKKKETRKEKMESRNPRPRYKTEPGAPGREEEPKTQVQNRTWGTRRIKRDFSPRRSVRGAKTALRGLRSK